MMLMAEFRHDDDMTHGPRACLFVETLRICSNSSSLKPRLKASNTHNIVPTIVSAMIVKLLILLLCSIR